MAIVNSITNFIKDTFAIGDVSASIVGVLPGRGYGSGTSAGAKWPGGLSASGSSPFINHFEMRQNARSACHDSVHARAQVTRMTDTVVDVGLKVEPDPNTEILGITSDEAQKWSESVGARFDLWAKSKKITRDETLNFYQLQRLVEFTQQRDNDYFVRFFYDIKRRDLINPLQLQMIDANQINGFAFTDTAGFQYNDYVDGIKRDSAGKEISYSVYVKQPDKSYKAVELPAYGPRSRKQLMIHGFAPEYPGQGRGYSNIGHAIQEFENLTDFTSAQIKKAIMQSSINMFVEPGPNAPATNPFDSITQDVAGPGNTLTVEGDASSTDEEGNFLDYVPIPEATLSTPGEVGVFNLNRGEKLKPFESTAPSERFESFVNAFLSYLSASNSMPIEVLLMKFSQNYSASRATLILFWRIAEQWRAELAIDFLNPVYEAWLSGEIAKGRISAPGWSDPFLRQAWLCNNWYGAPMPNIDPLRTVEADQKYAEMGATDLDRIAREHNGSSGKLNRAKITKQFKEVPVAPWGKQGLSNPAEKDTED